MVNTNPVKYVLDIALAEKVLAEVNVGVAAIFLQEPKPVRFVFLSYIASPANAKKDETVLGLCIMVSPVNEIQIRIRQGWQNTAIHELVHLYNPAATEEQVEKITRDTIKYLKMMNP